MFPSQAVGRVMPFVLGVVLPGATDQPRGRSFLPGNVRVGFKEQRGQIPSEKVTALTQLESVRGCALPAAGR